MADSARRLPTNSDGDVFVDDTCIDCGACRAIDPMHFDAKDGHSRVHTQPQGDDETHRALMALVACPTASIGAGGASGEAARVRAARDAFPEPLTDGVYRLGFASESSFGAMSYLVVRAGGNVLVDSPRFNRRLASAIEALGGARWMFLTHRDDVVDHDRWAARLGCARVLHADDVSARTRDVERKIIGADRVDLDDGLTVVPVPGHTRGSACLWLHDDTLAERVLFSGDHLAWRPSESRLIAFRSACWFSWPEQTRSMARMTDLRFSWVLPGHGHPAHLPEPEMAAQLGRCVEWMRST